MPQELTWRQAIEKVLSNNKGAMHYTDLTDKIIEEGLRTTLGATPAATVSGNLSQGINGEGANCPFQKVGKGLYLWKRPSGIAQTPLPIQSNEEGEDGSEPQYGIISSFGMYWRREEIEWVKKPEATWNANEQSLNCGLLTTNWHLPALRRKRSHLCGAYD